MKINVSLIENDTQYIENNYQDISNKIFCQLKNRK